MTRKDYILLAEAISDSGSNLGHDTWDEARKEIARFIADALASDNPRFNRARFMAACGF